MSGEPEMDPEARIIGSFKKLTLAKSNYKPLLMNGQGCLSLAQIYQLGNNPISEEQAWAIVFECCKCLQKLFTSKDKFKLYLVHTMDELFIHKDGSVHESTFQKTSTLGGSLRRIAMSEEKIVHELSMVIYSALESGIYDDGERELTPGLGNLLEVMLSFSDDDNNEDGIEEANEDDEGIEQDHEDDEHPRYEPVIIKSVLDLCTNHLSTGSEAESHFKNVCRAMVSETLELDSFLQRTQMPDMYDKELQDLALGDWANLWKQTVHDLRQGVKLKKTSFTKTPIEFALTPYEMLMDDIRSRRYKLNKVMVDGKLPPKVKKDAHDVILDFIRSRPPLKPASDRKLKPSEKTYTTQELMLLSIRSGEAREALKKTAGPPEPKKTFLVEAGMLYMEPTIIIEDDFSESSVLRPRLPSASALDLMSQPPTRTKYLGSVAMRRRGSAINSPATNGVICRSKSFVLPRPQYMTAINGSGKKKIIIPDAPFVKFDPDEESEDEDAEEMRPPAYHKSTDRPHLTPDHKAQFAMRPHLQHGSKSTANLQDSVPLSSSLSSGRNSTPLSFFASLTNAISPSPSDPFKNPSKEFIHLRSTMNKVKFEENFDLNESLRSDIEKSKVCFGCTKTKFNIFSRTFKCPWCQFVFCTDCISKVKVREDFFDQVPISALTPKSKDSSSNHVVKVRPKSIANFSALASISQSNGHLDYLSANERLDHLNLIENNENPYVRIIETPKRVSFGNFESSVINTPKFCGASRSRVQRSNTLGRVDTHQRARMHRRTSIEGKPVNLATCLQQQMTKEVEVTVCVYCKDGTEQ